MPFCSCGDLECICEGRCVCDRRCLCTVCRDLLGEERCKVCGLRSSDHELSASSTAPNVRKCTRNSPKKIDCLRHRLDSLGISPEAVTGDIPVSGSAVAEKDPGAKGLLQTSLNKTMSPKEQNILLDVVDGTFLKKTVKIDEQCKSSVEPIVAESSEGASSLTKCASTKRSPSAPTFQVKDKRMLKAISFTEKIIVTEDCESSSEDEIRTKRPSPSSRGSRRSAHSRSSSERSQDSNISILSLPESEWSSQWRENLFFSGDPTVAVSTVTISSVSADEADSFNLGSVPDRSVSPVQVISTVPRTVFVSPSGELRLLPLTNSRLSPSRIALPYEMQSPSRNALPYAMQSSSSSAEAFPEQATSFVSRADLQCQSNLDSTVHTIASNIEMSSPSKTGTLLKCDSQNASLPAESTSSGQLSQESAASSPKALSKSSEKTC